LNNDSKIKLFLVDDHDIVRDGLKSLLSNSTEIDIIGEASNAAQFFESLKNRIPDILLLDISLPDMSGIEIAKRLNETNPEIGILILSMFTDEDFIINSIKVGARGYLPKNSKKEELIKAITTVFNGGEYYPVSISEIVAKSYINQMKNKSISLVELLTEREKEIMHLVVDGFSNNEIADKLFISVRTVETHKSRILQKLDLKSTVDLVKFAIKNKIIEV
jgi:DNA-binding NarL/FixJ family response regulator